jgi:hypothetical protein
MAGGTLTASVVKDPASATNNIAVDASGNATIGNNLTVTALSTTNTLSVTGAASVGSTASVTGLLTVGASGIKFNDNTTQTTAAVSGGMTLLGTITTTSGSTQTLSGLTLTSYKQLSIVVQAVSSNSTTQELKFGVSAFTIFGGKLGAVSEVWTGIATIDLTNGYFSSNISAGASGATYNNSASSYGGKTDITTASTSITASNGSGTFDAGSILVYGVK